MSTLAQRLSEALSELSNKSQADLARACGVTSPSVNGWFSGKTQSLKDKSLTRAAAFLNVEEKWLSEGIGPKRKPQSIENVVARSIGKRMIPIISYVQAGNWTGIVDSYAMGTGENWLLSDSDVSDNAFALEIVGNSMAPQFNEGDMVIIDPNIAARPGDFVVAKNGSEEATFKKYRPRRMTENGDMVFELVPLNEDYPTLSSDVTPMQIIGTMVEHRIFRRR